MRYGILFVLLPIVMANGFAKYSYRSPYSDSQLFDSSFSTDHLQRLKNETQNLFYYAWDKYMDNAFPFDEVRPFSCKPLKRDRDPFNTVRNDIVGDFSAQLFDAMDTFIVINDKAGFHKCVKIIKEKYNDFAIDSTVQVFETNIRILGGLLSAHLFAIDERKGFHIESYDGHLLKLAYDLGKRLVLTFKREDDYQFEDPTLKYLTFNYPRTNLLRGIQSVPSNLQDDQCISGMTSLIVEFSMLSRLTNDTIFEDISKKSVRDFWNLRTKLDLLPMSFSTKLRKFTNQISGIGASIDSFYEYALKYSILFNDDDLLEIWRDSYKALLTHSQDQLGMFFNINASTSSLSTEWIDSLAAFFPGLQVLGGDIFNAIKLHLVYLNIWNHYGALPERWNFDDLISSGLFEYLGRPYKDGDVIPGLDLKTTNEILLRNSIGLEWYPLRPEFIESSYHLFQATKDPLFLKIGEDMVRKLRTEFLAPCGFAGLDDIKVNLKQNRMETFTLSETLKYLYLLFDNSEHSKIFQEGNTIFSTEAHSFWWDKKLYDYEKVSKKDLEQMNVVREIDTVQVSLFQKIMFQKAFNLNKEFEELKQKFYKEKQDSRYIERMIRGSESIFGDAYKFGQQIVVDRTLHDSLQFDLRSQPFKVKKINGSELQFDYLHLDTCAKYDTGLFPQSAILGSDEMYLLGRDYPMNLRTPTYRQAEEPMEISPLFYDKYCPKEATCPAPHSSITWDALILGEDNYNIAAIYEFKTNQNLCSTINPSKGDLFIPYAESLKVKFETISNGVIDTYGNIVQLQPDQSSVLRLLRVNGVQIKTGQRIFLSSEDPYLTKSDTMITHNGSLHIQGVYVTNISVI